ncbi:hypothetical protein [Terracoccus luteus]|uniref:PknH-like protein n=1 Tax=Terracoccus luteus TaxID=53356 RepID=A0A839Q1G2_9MICO|nr:hypothetical protein [Terracoccus luteus]MBB2988135.1 hypothetical protein [Terracoccus luteus]MCP2173770.1 hypothetical protein [Terracoccus luteus]
MAWASALMGVAALALTACSSTLAPAGPGSGSPAASAASATTSSPPSTAPATTSSLPVAAPILWSQVEASLDMVLPLLQDRAPTLTDDGDTRELTWRESDRFTDVITKRNRAQLSTGTSCEERRRNLTDELDAEIGKRTSRVDWAGGNGTALRAYVTQVADPAAVQARWTEYLTSADCGGLRYFEVPGDGPAKARQSTVTVAGHVVRQVLLDAPAVPDKADAPGRDARQFVFQSTIEQDRLIILEGANMSAVTPEVVTEIMNTLLKAQQPS